MKNSTWPSKCRVRRRIAANQHAAETSAPLRLAWPDSTASMYAVDHPMPSPSALAESHPALPDSEPPHLRPGDAANVKILRSHVPIETPMKILAAAFCALSIAMLPPTALHPQPASAQSQFQVEIHSAGQQRPTCVITNLSGKPVSAFVFEISASSQPARKAQKVWDSILAGHQPIQPGASIMQDIYEFAFSPTPDKIKVVAAVFTDGETFGAPASVNRILNSRAARAAEYEDAARILQQGLSQNWTRDQYQQAFRDKPDNGAVYTVRTALSATLQNGQTPEEFTHTMQFLLTTFQKLSAQLRKVKPI